MTVYLYSRNHVYADVLDEWLNWKYTQLLITHDVDVCIVFFFLQFWNFLLLRRFFFRFLCYYYHFECDYVKIVLQFGFSVPYSSVLWRNNIVFFIVVVRSCEPKYCSQYYVEIRSTADGRRPGRVFIYGAETLFALRYSQISVRSFVSFSTGECGVSEEFGFILGSLSTR